MLQKLQVQSRKLQSLYLAIKIIKKQPPFGEVAFFIFLCYIGIMDMITEKQREYLLSTPSRINLLDGSVRSGKTWISLVAWALFVASMPKDAEFLMVGKTLTTLRRNCLGLLQDLEPSFRYQLSAKKASLYGRTIWLEGADNERA